MKILNNPKLKKLALWIKRNSKAFNVFGALFFFATILSTILWMIGANIEPIVVLLSLITSTFFALPYSAEFILPSRKAIRDMTYEELLKFVEKSDPKNDWKGISKDLISENFLKEDPRLRFRVKYTEDGIQNEDYVDDWANNHLHRKATGYWCDLFYDWNFIDRFILVSIDGGRAMLPPPDLETKTITELAYRVAQIHDVSKTLDDYLKRSGIKVQGG